MHSPRWNCRSVRRGYVAGAVALRT